MANTCISKHRDGRFCHWHRIVIFHADFRSMVMLNPRIKAGSVQFGDNWRILIFFFSATPFPPPLVTWSDPLS
jgi:hypothetical protein